MMNSNCKARQYSDQMICGTCGLAWDVNDPEPPKCNPVKPSVSKHRAKTTKMIGRIR